MSLGFKPLRRKFERLLATFSVVAVLMSMMVVFAPAALAHHPEISANQTCVDQEVMIAYESVSWKTDGTSGSGHSDIRIEVRVNGTGSWTQVGNGAFNAGNNYRFSGSFDAEPYWGQSIEVRALAVGPWDNGVGGGETRVTAPFQVSQECFNPSCPAGYFELKVENPTDGTFGPNDEFEIDITDGASGPTFDWSSTVPVFQVIVKGGPGANVYDYPPPGEFSDTGLHAPLNPNNGKWYGLSHITFCYGDPQPEPVDVTPSVGACALDQQGLPNGEVSFAIDPSSGATVQVYANSDFTGPVGGVLGDGEALSLDPGTYYWQATAGEGFEIDGADSGQFTIEPCTGSVSVSSGACDLIDGPLGPVEVTIDPDDAATVTIYSDAAMTDEVASFGEDGGSTTLPPGTYYWSAEAANGFDLEGDTEGQFTIEACEASIVIVTSGCSLNQAGFPVGVVEVTIDPESSATVVVSGAGGPYAFSVSGSQELAPGSYSWDATASPGFALTGDDSGEFDIDPCDVAVLVTNGDCQLIEGPLGSGTVFIDADSGATVTVYDAEMNVAASFDGVGGTSNLAPGTYTWVAVPGEGFEFPEGEQTSGEFTIAPCSSTVLVTQGECSVGDGPVGSVLAEIDPDSGATVIVRDADLNVVATFSGSGGSIDLPPGSYTWTASPVDGFTVTGDTSGEFTILPCGSSVIVTHGNCVEDAPTAYGLVTVGIVPEGAASVTVLDSSHLEVAVFGDAGGEQTLLAGDYTWSAEAMPGYELTGATSGAFEVVACDDEVQGEVILPFTGMDSEQLLGASILLLGLGIYLIHIARRGEEG
jgi:hypothetical protein